MHKEFMSQAILEKMKVLNNKLQNLQIKIFKIASEYDHSLKQRVDDSHDPLQEYEINAKIYLTREQNDLWKREVIVIDQNSLEGITYKKRQIDIAEWILNAKDHCDGGIRASYIKDLQASYLFHQLYYHEVNLAEENVRRELTLEEIVSFTMVDFTIEFSCFYWDGDGEEPNIYDTKSSY